MSRRPSPLPPHVEADVAERLSRALAHGPVDAAVDVVSLAHGTRRGIARAAARRRATVVAAAVAAVAVPLGVFVLSPGGSTQSVGPAATATGSSTPTGTPTTTPTGTPTASPTTSPTDVPTTTVEPPSPSRTDPPASPNDPPSTTAGPTDPYTADPGSTVVPIASLPGDGDPRHVAYLVPDAMTLDGRTDFPTPLVLLGDIADYRWQPTVPGQGCGNGHTPSPVGARQWGWAEENSNRLDQFSASVVVSGWKPGTTHARFADIAQDDGVCHWLDTPTPVSAATLAAMPGDEAWAASFNQNNAPVGRAAIRVGDVIVAVEVFDPAGEKQSVTAAIRLASKLADRAGTSGLAATAAKGG